MTETIASLNAATDASLAARTKTEPATKPATARKPRATGSKKTAAAPAPLPIKANGRRARTPQERAKLPVTSTIAAYVEWLDKNVYGGKMTAQQKSVAGVSITLYGAYQISPERRAARGA